MEKVTARTADIVYVVRTGDENPELRYSLRSLQNVASHGTIHIAGFIPSWINGNLNRLPVTANPNKFRSAENNLLAAIESDQVSDPFWLFNDDFFIMRSMRQIPSLHRGSLQEVTEDYEERHSGSYALALRHALNLLLDLGIEQPLCWEMHSPLLVHKQQMKEALELRGRQDRFMLRSVYGNLQKLRGRKSEDVKVYRGTGDLYKTWPLLSTSDILFKYSAPGSYIRHLFPDRSQYEK